MNIYYTDNYGRRRLQECCLSELEVNGVQATDGVQTYKMYTIYNDIADDCAVITFGGQEHIAENLRDAFWRSVAATFKNNIPLFDVDEWYSNINFVKAEQAAPEAEKVMRKKKKRSIRINQRR